MNIHVDSFYANNKDLVICDILHDVRIGTTKEGIINLHFKTTDKYVRVQANGSVADPDYKGMLVSVYPYIDGYDYDLIMMDDTKWDEYYSHPKYYRLQLVVETKGYSYTSVVTALKHEYFVSFVPDDMVMNYECLEKAVLTLWE
jgi:hypothetical protein